MAMVIYQFLVFIISSVFASLALVTTIFVADFGTCIAVLLYTRISGYCVDYFIALFELINLLLFALFANFE